MRFARIAIVALLRLIGGFGGIVVAPCFGEFSAVFLLIGMRVVEECSRVDLLKNGGGRKHALLCYLLIWKVFIDKSSVY